ncbi:hypothetical protein BCR34DRAFT_328018 [Clohesyomyces aquaticus]|uniref:Uncharacterized protein n=1 Tax=Clohesyomyces aquaticus TaxID=1231657 RepID=A0A1Y1ZNF9_9PLEO|nr:hypothetical protein BCR34DRAFT_328018 [Clohesyomyces aquaticus]
MTPPTFVDTSMTPAPMIYIALTFLFLFCSPQPFYPLPSSNIVQPPRLMPPPKLQKPPTFHYDHIASSGDAPSTYKNLREAPRPPSPQPTVPQPHQRTKNTLRKPHQHHTERGYPHQQHPVFLTIESPAPDRSKALPPVPPKSRQYPDPVQARRSISSVPLSKPLPPPPVGDFEVRKARTRCGPISPLFEADSAILRESSPLLSPVTVIEDLEESGQEAELSSIAPSVEIEKEGVRSRESSSEYSRPTVSPTPAPPTKLQPYHPNMEKDGHMELPRHSVDRNEDGSMDMPRHNVDKNNDGDVDKADHPAAGIEDAHTEAYQHPDDRNDDADMERGSYPTDRNNEDFARKAPWWKGPKAQWERFQAWRERFHIRWNQFWSPFKTAWGWVMCVWRPFWRFITWPFCKYYEWCEMYMTAIHMVQCAAVLAVIIFILIIFFFALHEYLKYKPIFDKLHGTEEKVKSAIESEFSHFSSEVKGFTSTLTSWTKDVKDVTKKIGDKFPIHMARDEREKEVLIRDIASLCVEAMVSPQMDLNTTSPSGTPGSWASLAPSTSKVVVATPKPILRQATPSLMSISTHISNLPRALTPNTPIPNPPSSIGHIPRRVTEAETTGTVSTPAFHVTMEVGGIGTREGGHGSGKAGGGGYANGAMRPRNPFAIFQWRSSIDKHPQAQSVAPTVAASEEVVVTAVTTGATTTTTITSTIYEHEDTSTIHAHKYTTASMKPRGIGLPLHFPPLFRPATSAGLNEVVRETTTASFLDEEMSASSTQSIGAKESVKAGAPRRAPLLNLPGRLHHHMRRHQSQTYGGQGSESTPGVTLQTSQPTNSPIVDSSTKRADAHDSSDPRDTTPWTYWKAYMQLHLDTTALCAHQQALSESSSPQRRAPADEADDLCSIFEQKFKGTFPVAGAGKSCTELEDLYKALKTHALAYCEGMGKRGDGESKGECQCKRSRGRADEVYCMSVMVVEETEVGGCDLAESVAASLSAAATSQPRSTTLSDSKTTSIGGSSKSSDSGHSLTFPAQEHGITPVSSNVPASTTNPSTAGPPPTTAPPSITAIVTIVAGPPTTSFPPPSSTVPNIVPVVTYAHQSKFNPAARRTVSIDPNFIPPSWTGPVLSKSWSDYQPFATPPGYNAPNTVPAAAQTGELTFFNPGSGACGGEPEMSENELAVAISWEIFDLGKNLYGSPELAGEYQGMVNASKIVTDGSSMLCNRWVRAWMGDAAKEFMVRDRCAGCRPQDLDIQPGIFWHYWAPQTGGRISMTWSWLGGEPTGTP